MFLKKFSKNWTVTFVTVYIENDLLRGINVTCATYNVWCNMRYTWSDVHKNNKITVLQLMPIWQNTYNMRNTILDLPVATMGTSLEMLMSEQNDF